MATDTRPDAELVTAWVAGDQSAFAAVYDRYADALFAFAVSRLRDRAAAADAVQDTFLRAARRVDQLRDRTRLRAWLYAIARNQVIDAVRTPEHLATTELEDMTSDERDPADTAAAHEAAALLRDAALGLNARDQELLDLHLRHGLDGADLADVAGLSRPQSYVAMNRLRARLAKAVGVVLIARHGSRDCAGLAQLLRGWDGRFTLEVRSRVTRHVEGCAACGEQRTKLVAAVQLSPGGLAIPVAAPVLLRRSTIERVAQVRPPVSAGAAPGTTGAAPAATGGATGAAGAAPPAAAGSLGDLAAARAVSSGRGTGAWRRDGFPVTAAHGARRRAAVILTAAAVVVALLVVVAVVRRDDAGTAPDAVAAAPASATTVPSAPTTTPAPAATTAGAATALTASTAAPTSVATSTSALTTTTPTTEAPSTVPASVPAVPGGTEPGLAPPGADPSTTGPAATDPPTEDTPAITETPPAPPVPEPTAAPPPPPPEPGRITVVSGPITLAGSVATGTIRIRNDGGQPAGWSAAAGAAAFGVSPAAGSLEPGQQTDLTVAVDRDALAEGTHTAAVAVGAEQGGGSVDVTAIVERDPVINAFVRTPPLVRTSGSCGPTLVSVAVTAADESPIGSVAVQWSSDGVFAQLTNLASVGGGGYSGQVGSFTSPGEHSLKAIVTDARGNTTSQTASVTVVPC